MMWIFALVGFFILVWLMLLAIGCFFHRGPYNPSDEESHLWTPWGWRGN